MPHSRHGLHAAERSAALRAGFTLAELATGMVIGGILSAAAVAALLTQQRLATHMADTLAAAATARIAGAVLPAELRYLYPPEDLAGMGRDTVALRAMRGFAVACDTSAGTILVRYRGLREPDPSKDSVIVVAGGHDALRLASSSTVATGCDSLADEALYRWRVDTTIAPGTPLLLFERGTYHLGSDLRYRRGAGGRQPLTPELFDPDSTGFDVERVTGTHAPTGAPTSATILLAPVTGPGSRAPERMPPLRLRVPFVNGVSPGGAP